VKRDTSTTCSCGRPTRDDAYVCEDCAQRLARALGDVPALAAELDTTIARQKGIDYRATSTGGTKTQPLGYEPTAADARTALHALLVSWVRFCDAEQVRHQSHSWDLPADTLTGLSRWLLWRVDGLTLHDQGPEAVRQIVETVNACWRHVDRPADPQDLGPCDECSEGRYKSHKGASWARCTSCGDVIDAEERRQLLLTRLDDRLCTAAEIAHLSTYLGLRDNRERVRNRVNQWHRRGRIVPEPAATTDPVFRFGIVWRLLTHEDQKGGAA
jgi:hypothetical protein